MKSGVIGITAKKNSMCNKMIPAKNVMTNKGTIIYKRSDN